MKRPAMPLAQPLRAGAIYFALVFAAGFLLGVMRTLVLLQRLGATWAVVVELPIILTLSWIVSARILQRIPMSLAGAAVMGGFAFALLMAGEAAISVLLAGRTLQQHLSLYAEPAHQLGLLGQLGFALFPMGQVGRRCCSNPTAAGNRS